MKRLGSSDSLGALMDICPTTTEHQHNNNEGNNNDVYTRDFQTMLEGLDEEGCVEESSHMREKKRRLSVEQVKALEKYFEVENKLEPERKVKLAQELGLQPRQVAVWFQNRRARWKTKQLERDYGILKASYDSLKHNYDTLKQDNESLLKEIRELKAKIHEDKTESKVVVKEEGMVSENENQTDLANNYSDKCDDDTTEMNFESFNNNNNNGVMGVSIFLDFKDGSSDSDSSAILNNEDNNNHNNNNSNSPKGVNSSSSGGVLQCQSPNHFLISNGGSSSSPSTSKNGCFQILEDAAHKAYQPQFVKIEEHNFFSGEDSCTTFFADDQAPTLHWYNPDEWN